MNAPRLGRRTMFLTAFAVLLASCSGEATEVQVGSGTLRSGPWSAWVYDSLTTGVCLEIRPNGADADRLCDLKPDNIATWRPTTNEGDAEFLAGTTAEAAAELAVVTLADGAQVETEVEQAPEVSPLRFFIMTIPGGAEARRLDLLDGEGEIIDSQPME